MSPRIFAPTFVLLFACIAATAFAQPAMVVEATARQADGRILVAGQASPAQSPAVIHVGRLHADGSLDTSFGDGGWKAWSDPIGGVQLSVRAIAGTGDGRIVLGLQRDELFALAKLTSDGAPDASFGIQAPGLAIDNLSAPYALWALHIQASGEIVALGSYAGEASSYVRTAALVRYWSYGQRDYGNGAPAYGARFPLLGTDAAESEFRAVAPWASNGFMAGGRKLSGGLDQFLLTAFTSLLDVDTMFASTGHAVPAVGTLRGLATRPGQFVVAVGHDAHYAGGQPANNVVAVKLDAWGTPDWQFGQGGGMLTQPVFVDGYWDATARGIAALPIDGDVVLAGHTVQVATGRSYFFTLPREGDYADPIRTWETRAGPRTDGDDTLAGAFEGNGYFVLVGTRDGLAGERPVRVRFFSDTGEFDTDFPTEGPDTTPNPFGFGAETGSGPAQTWNSYPPRISGINVPLPISIAGGSYAICNGYNVPCSEPTTAPGTVTNGQLVYVTLTTSAVAGANHVATVTLGDTVATYEVRNGDVPDTSIDSRPSTPGGTSATFSYSSNAGGSFECRLDAAAWSACPYHGITYAGLADGPHTFEVRATNAWGTDPTPATHTWSVSFVPDTTITSAPPAGAAPPYNSGNATFAFASDSGSATFECKLDAAAFAACASPKTYEGLADGAHTFQVRAVNAAGIDPSPATLSWTIDTTAPIVSITTKPPLVSGSTNASFGFGANEASTWFEVSMDGAPFVSYTYNPQSYSGLAAGSHTFAVRGRDWAGNTGAAATYTWTIDTTPPTTQITGGPSGVVTSPFQAVSFVSNEANATFECQHAGSYWSNCTSPWNVYAPTEGTHTFYVRARDAAGNFTPNWTSISWIMDATPPETTIVAGPSGVATTDSATFDYASNEAGARFECSLDGAAFSACPSNGRIVYSGLAQGAHTFRVQAIDVAGRVDETPATRSWSVDSIAPDTTITSGPPQYVGTSQIVIAFASNDPAATFQCSWDNAPYAACQSPVNISFGRDDMHEFRVRAVDPAGNVDPTPAFLRFFIDTEPPDTFLFSTPSALTASDTATFTFYADPVYTHECRLDAQPFAPCGSPVTYNGLASGTHAFSVRAIDQAGNVDPTPASYQWVVDHDAPDTLVTSGPNPVSGFTDATFAFQSSEPGATYECRLDAAAFAACTSPISYGGLAEGAHTFQVRAIDGLGNADATPGSFTWTVDTSAPETTISSGPPSATRSTSASIAFASGDAGAGFECRFDAAAFVACASPASIAGLADGNHTFQVRAIDGAGNTDASPATWSWTVDTLVPDTTLTGGPSGNNNPATATFTFTATEAGASFDCSLDGAPFVACASGVTYSGLARGDHAFQVRARDAAGNVDATPAARSWKVR